MHADRAKDARLVMPAVRLVIEACRFLGCLSRKENGHESYVYMLAMHGRKPFKGERRVLVALD